MCGNFGLLLLQKRFRKGRSKLRDECFLTRDLVLDELDRSLNKSRSNHPRRNEDNSVHVALQVSIETMRKVSQLNRIRLNESIHGFVDLNSTSFFDYDAPRLMIASEVPMLSLLHIIETQASSTEVRGGQAGGISCIEYNQENIEDLNNDAIEDSKKTFPPVCTRVRCLGRRRFALATMLTALFKKKCKQLPSTSSSVTILGHTRFATGSFNTVPELHPHEWVPFHEERIWSFRTRCLKSVSVGVHITHNGDFDALHIYGQKIVNGDVGLWLERVLHVENDSKGDSPKIAGCFDLFLVQGRWGAAARLAYLRCCLSSPTDVCKKEPLSKTASNTFPGLDVWDKIGDIFYEIWVLHANNVVKTVREAPDLDCGGAYFSIIATGEAQLCSHLVTAIGDVSIVGGDDCGVAMSAWSPEQRKAFVYHTVRGFLRFDLYTAMTEFLSRAEGSFGLQVHSTLEPGVVVIASKGQPMSVAFDPKVPLCLFGSEAEAVAAPVDESGRWLPQRIDLDSRGEIVRVGVPRMLTEGRFDEGVRSRRTSLATADNTSAVRGLGVAVLDSTAHCLQLECGIEIRAFSLGSCREVRRSELIDRVLEVLTAPVPYDPRADLVASDLTITPATLSRIDEAWNNSNTHESGAGRALCSRLVEAMSVRRSVNKDSIDLLVGGVEASLWIAEQWAADLRSLFPFLNIVTQSANKLMGLEIDTPGKIFFSGCESISSRRVDSATCVVLISQSGQTFPTLHATRKVAGLVGDRLWILTGCFHSKMEQVLREAYRDRRQEYSSDRVFNNYSGNCPAEPTSVAAAATHHTLTRLLLMLIEMTAASQAPKQPAMDMSVNQLSLSPDLSREDVSLDSCREIPNGLSDAVVPLSEAKGTMIDVNLPPLMTLAAVCVEDARMMLTTAVIPGLEKIVGVDRDMKPLTTDGSISGGAGTSKDGDVHEKLVQQGRVWARHVQEPWEVLVLVGAYLVVSVGFGLPIFGTLARIVQAVIAAATGGLVGADGVLHFSPLDPSMMRSQPVLYTVIGLIIQIIDAVFYVYLAKMFTWGSRWLGGRPLWARHGRRTLVVVDSPMVHQLTENYVSKLFSQSYGFCGLDVHGANGLDHFVHRFTHRVCRGVLLAVGRPDGRLCCLAKSECALILATKQAAFIQNSDYSGDGSGPDIVSIGHNNFSPNLGLVRHVVLPGTRGAFLDEIVFEQLSGHPRAGEAVLELLRRIFLRIRKKRGAMEGKLYGMKLVEDFVSDAILGKMNGGTTGWGKLHQGDIKRLAESYDPAGSVAFISRLDGKVQALLQLQRPLQQLYEGRVAALERYLSFCVMFHAMAKQCSSPWFRPAWDVARSQSNLRIATTASPVAVSDASELEWTADIHHNARVFASKLRGFTVHM